jgi:SARP family transcriptional regulator, regulator of embCAB operon
VLAEDLGIDPGPSVSALHERILRQERLDTKQAARATAARSATTTHTAFGRESAVGGLRDAAGRHYPLQPAATKIGRLPDK